MCGAMDFDELFPSNEDNEELMAQNVNDEFNELEEDYQINTRRPKAVKRVEHNNKIGWVLRKPDKGKCLEYVEFHKTTNIPGSVIKNAITGDFYGHLVGSNNEKLLFKVVLASAEKGTLNYINGEWLSEPCLLFYDSPEEYERHFYCVLSPIIKQRWIERKKGHKIAKKTAQ